MSPDPTPRERQEALYRELLPEDLYNRLHFIHWAIVDTQETIRFLDTKAAFCVTLLSGMVAVSLQHPIVSHLDRYILFPLFLVVISISLIVALRVIFPTFFPTGSGAPPVRPKFFIAHGNAHHWIRHTIRNPRTPVLSETPQSYVESIHAANDAILAASLSETLVTISAIRQVKSDRLHAALYCLGAAIVLFGVIMFTQSFTTH